MCAVRIQSSLIFVAALALVIDAVDVQAASVKRSGTGDMSSLRDGEMSNHDERRVNAGKFKKIEGAFTAAETEATTSDRLIQRSMGAAGGAPAATKEAWEVGVSPSSLIQRRNEGTTGAKISITAVADGAIDEEEDTNENGDMQEENNGSDDDEDDDEIEVEDDNDEEDDNDYDDDMRSLVEEDEEEGADDRIGATTAAAAAEGGATTAAPKEGGDAAPKEEEAPAAKKKGGSNMMMGGAALVAGGVGFYLYKKQLEQQANMIPDKEELEKKEVAELKELCTKFECTPEEDADDKDKLVEALVAKKEEKEKAGGDGDKKEEEEKKADS